MFKNRKLFKRPDLIAAFIFGLLIVLCHALIHPGQRDDVWFAEVLNDKTLPEYLAFRYEFWTARLLVEVTLAVFTRNLILWRIVNVFAIFLLAYSISKINGFKHTEYVFVAMCLFPWIFMRETGWATTFICYIWPFACGVWALSVLKELYVKGRIPLLKTVVALVAFAYSVNFEQVLVLFFCALVYFLIRTKLEKSSQTFMLAVCYMLVDLFMLAFSLICPGNANRTLQEATSHMPEFFEFNLIDKAVLGLNSTFVSMPHRDLVPLVFFVVIFVYAFCHRRKLSFVLNMFSAAYYCVIYALTAFDTGFYGDGDVSLAKAYLFFALNMCFVVLVLVTLMFLTDNMPQNLFLCTIWGAGMLTRVMMGFSPTCFFSGQRTYTYLDFATLFVALRLVIYFKKDSKIESYA